MSPFSGKKDKEFLFQEIEPISIQALDREIAKVRDKKDFINGVLPKIQTLFGTENVFVCIYDQHKKNLNPFVRVSSKELAKSDSFSPLLNFSFPVKDGFINKILNSNKPKIFDFETLDSWSKPPEYLKIIKDNGIKKSLSQVLHLGENQLGILTFWFPGTTSLNEGFIPLIKQVAEQTSNALSIILTNEEKKHREIDNEKIRLINDELASVRNRDDLSKILSITLKQYIPYNSAFISLYNTEKNIFELYCHTTQISNDNFLKLQNSLFPVQYRKDNLHINPHIPEKIKVPKQRKKDPQLSLSISLQNKEFLKINLKDGEDIIGVMVLISDSPNSFTNSYLYIIQRIAYQISITVSKLLTLEELNNRENEKEILLRLSRELTTINDKSELIPLLKSQLEKLSFYNDISIALVDSNKKTFSSFLVNTDSPRIHLKDYAEMKNARHPFPDGVFEVGLKSKVPVFFELETLLKLPKVPSYITYLWNSGTKAMAAIPLKNRNKGIGILYCFSKQIKEFTPHQLSLVQGIGEQLGAIVANILANEEIKKREMEKSFLLTLSKELAQIHQKEELFISIQKLITELFSDSECSLLLLNPDQLTYQIHFISKESQFGQDNSKDVERRSLQITDGVFDKINNFNGPTFLDSKDLESEDKNSPLMIFVNKKNIKSAIGLPLRVGEEKLGSLMLFPKDASVKNISINLLQGVGSQLSIALSNIIAKDRIEKQLTEIKQYKDQLELENFYLHEVTNTGFSFNDIIGSGDEMKRLFNLLSQISSVNSTVLLMGETGTGKELIARAIHNSSPRKDKLLVKINCAAIPSNLMESELFGHEKGAFTGAAERRIGKFELANKGSLFLDEIGELPLDLQSKLLRVLQEKEIERVGGKEVITTDARIIAATNRDLQTEVNEGRFRSDLFYRLNVFPITIPPLRKRKEDIPELTVYFLEKYCKKIGIKTKSISDKALSKLMDYNWPGNIRELEHILERSIVLTTGSSIEEIHLPSNNSSPHEGVESIKTLEQVEREHILFALNFCKGKIFGSGGAAELLGLHVSTLNSRIKKLGIKKLNPVYKKS